MMFKTGDFIKSEDFPNKIFVVESVQLISDQGYLIKDIHKNIEFILRKNVIEFHGFQLAIDYMNKQKAKKLLGLI